MTSNVTLEDRLAILDLCARYNWHTDTGDADGVAQLFTPEGVFDGPSERFEGRQAIRDFNETIHQEIRGSMHFNNNHQMHWVDDHIYHRCYSALQIATADVVKTHLMTYRDRIVPVAGDWLFLERVNRFFDATDSAYGDWP